MTERIPSIQNRFNECDNSLQAISRMYSARPEADGLYKQINPVTLQREHTRLIRWAQNVGAHRADRLSLEHRLRDASRIKAEVMNVFEELQETISESKSGLVMCLETDVLVGSTSLTYAQCWTS